MKKTFADYKHLLWLLFIPFYLAAFVLLEKYGNNVDYLVTDVPLDAKISFQPWAVIFYLLWYPMLIGTGLQTICKDKAAFSRYMRFLCIAFFGTLLLCLLIPNGQNLRPESFEQDNMFTKIIGWIYEADTNTNVLPSMHIVGCLACIFASFDSKAFPASTRGLLIAVSVMIGYSTLAIKQHGVVDVLFGLGVGLFLGIVLYAIPRIVRNRKAEAEQPKLAQN